MSVTTRRILQLEKEIEHLREINTELLAACEEALNWLGGYNACIEEEKAIAVVRAAVAKAKGQP